MFLSEIAKNFVTSPEKKTTKGKRITEIITKKMTATKTTFAKKTENKPLYAFRPDVGFLVFVW